MSSTNRGSERKENDFYETPISAIEPLIPYIKMLPGPFWEPACGNGAIVKKLRHNGMGCLGSDILTPTDICNWFIGKVDFLHPCGVAIEVPWKKANWLLNTDE